LKKSLLLLPLICLAACRKDGPPAAAVRSADYNKAVAFYGHQNDSAFYYFSKVAGSLRDSLETALAYNWMGELQSDAGDYFGSQESLTRSLQFLADPQAAEYSCLVADYNELGMTSLKLKHYDAAIGFYKQALKYTAAAGTRATILNNQANAYQQQKDYDQAIRLFKIAIKQAPPGSKTYARALTNLAFTQWRRRPNYNPVPELLTALAIRVKQHDLWGQNASYAHLSDYYMGSKPDSALFYTRAMYAVARQLNSPDDRLESLRKLVLLGSQPALNFPVYLRTADSLQTARNAAKNQFALIRYHTEESKAANLKLQKDNTEKRYQLIKQRALLYTLLLTLLAVVIWYRKRTRTAVRESQLKTSKKVHDVVANGLYRIMTELDHQSDIDKTRLADKIEDLYEQSRDISYEKAQYSPRPFNERLAGLVTAFATAATKVALAGNSKELWQQVTSAAQYEIENILQELMVNMKKHSRASSVAIRFEQEGKQLHIYYTDNGIGLDSGKPFGNGLNNTVSRITGLKGTLTFDTSVEQGLKLHLALPVL
jgi:signal transduction histidine kinase